LPVYVDEYNRQLAFTAQVDPEASTYFRQIDLGKDRNAADVIGPMRKSYAELAAVRLNSLASYLQPKRSTKLQEYEQIIDLINANLRAAIYEDPTHERDFQNVLETIFRAPALDLRREQDSAPYSTKRYIPDFTFNRIGLAVEVKLSEAKDNSTTSVGGTPARNAVPQVQA
jgi:hypothetical protein